MSISGHELIARLQGLIANQSRNEEREYGRTMAKLVMPNLQAHSAEQHADEVFDLFRRARRDALSVRSRREGLEVARSSSEVAFERTIQTISNEMMAWGNFDSESITRFYLESLDAFEELQRDFNKTRSRRSHLSAIFRPFKERYVSTWDRYLDTYPTEQVRAESSRIQDEVVTLTNLDQWAARVFDLFVLATVYSPEMNRKQHVDDAPSTRMPVQLGLINQNSVEIYRGRWKEFLTLNRNEIEAELSSQEPSQRLSMASSATGSNFDANYLSNDGFSYSSYGRGKSSPTPTVNVVVSLSENESVNAQRSWVSNETASSEIGMWLAMLQALWATAGTTVTSKVRFSSAAGDSEVTVPSLEFDAAATLLPQLIRNYR
jgi:hypothetical protein